MKSREFKETVTLLDVDLPISFEAEKKHENDSMHRYYLANAILRQATDYESVSIEFPTKLRKWEEIYLKRKIALQLLTSVIPNELEVKDNIPQKIEKLQKEVSLLAPFAVRCNFILKRYKLDGFDSLPRHLEDQLTSLADVEIKYQTVMLANQDASHLEDLCSERASLLRRKAISYTTACARQSKYDHLVKSGVMVFFNRPRYQGKLPTIREEAESDLIEKPELKA